MEETKTTDTALSKITAAEETLNGLIAEHEGQVFDLTKTKGFNKLKEVRAEFRNVRLDIGKTSKKINDHLNAAKKNLKFETERVTALVRIPEDHYSKMVTEEQDRRDEIKRVKDEAERLRVSKIQDLIHKISDTSNHAGSFNSVKLAEVIGIMEKYAIGDFFQEFKDQAEAARVRVIGELHDFHHAAVRREEEDQARKDEDARLAKQKAAQDARQAELDAIDAKAKAEAEEAEQKAKLYEFEDRLKAAEDADPELATEQEPPQEKPKTAMREAIEIPADLQETRPIKELADAVVENAVEEIKIEWGPTVRHTKDEVLQDILNMAFDTSISLDLRIIRIMDIADANMGGSGA